MYRCNAPSTQKLKLAALEGEWVKATDESVET